MTTQDAAGFLASGLVIAAFCTKDIVPLRALALASNVAFLAYGLSLDLAPVWLLHAILLPVNWWRLSQEMRRRSGTIEAFDAQRIAAPGAITQSVCTDPRKSKQEVLQ